MTHMILQDDAIWLSSIIYFIPSACQSAIFSLFVIFYAKLYYGAEWKQYKKTIEWTGLIFNIQFLLFMIAAAVLFELYTSDPTVARIGYCNNTLQMVYLLICVVNFTILCVVGALFMYGLYSIEKPSEEQNLFMTDVVVLSWSFLILLSRSLFDFASAFATTDSNVFCHFIEESAETGQKGIGASTFTLIMIWEILPSLGIIYYFKQISYHHHSRCHTGCPSLLFFCYFFMEDDPNMRADTNHDQMDVRREREFEQTVLDEYDEDDDDEDLGRFSVRTDPFLGYQSPKSPYDVAASMPGPINIGNHNIYRQLPRQPPMSTDYAQHGETR